AGGEREQTGSVKANRGIFKLREGEGKSLGIAGVVATEHEVGLGAAAGFEHKVAGDVDHGKSGAGTQLGFERGPGKALVGENHAVDGAVGLRMGRIVDDGVEFGDDAGERGQTTVAFT